MPRMTVPARRRKIHGRVQHVQRDVLHAGEAIGRQLHDHERRRALEERALEEPRKPEGAEGAERVHQDHDADLGHERHAIAGQERGDHE